MSGIWKKMNEKELDDVKGTGPNPCYTIDDSLLPGPYKPFADGSCQPAYEWHQRLNQGDSSSSASLGNVCASR